MTDTTVPCRAPYVGRNIDQEELMAVLKVGRGDEMEIFTVPVELLRKGSEYFADRLQDFRRIKISNNLSSRTFMFASESPAHFKVFTTFLYTGALTHPNLRPIAASKYYYRFVTELFAFAGYFSAYSFRNALLDAFFTRIASAPDDFPYGSVQDVYDCTDASSSLRNLVVDVVVNTGRKGDIKLWKQYLLTTFLVDCIEGAAEEEKVMFAYGVEEVATQAWLEDKKERLCGDYHVHTREELRAARTEDDMEMDGDGDDGGLDMSDKVKAELSVIEDLQKLRID